MAQRSFKLSDELDAKLVVEAERQGRSVSNLILWAITRELTPSPFSVDDPSVRYEQKRSKVDPAVTHDQKVLDETKPPNRLLYPSEGTPLPKIAPRKQR